jgi:hypothetical protein
MCREKPKHLGAVSFSLAEKARLLVRESREERRAHATASINLRDDELCEEERGQKKM